MSLDRGRKPYKSLVMEEEDEEDTKKGHIVGTDPGRYRPTAGQNIIGDNLKAFYKKN
jgi:hypothetical protein